MEEGDVDDFGLVGGEILMNARSAVARLLRDKTACASARLPWQYRISSWELDSDSHTRRRTSLPSADFGRPPRSGLRPRAEPYIWPTGLAALRAHLHRRIISLAADSRDSERMSLSAGRLPPEGSSTYERPSSSLSAKGARLTLRRLQP